MAEILKEQKLFTKSQIESHTDLEDVATAEELLKGKVTALLFSASWCPPCLKFLPILETFYNKLKESECAIEVVFVSLDHSKKSMEDYFISNHGNWYALPFDESLKDELTSTYHITAIPKLVVIRKNGEVITLKGRKDVQDKGTSCFRAWLNNSIPKDHQNQSNSNAVDACQGEETLEGEINPDMLALKQDSLESADNMNDIQGEILAQLIDATVFPQEQSSSNVSLDSKQQTGELTVDDSSQVKVREINPSDKSGDEPQLTTGGTVRSISTISEEGDDLY